MTVTITKSKLALGLVAIALLGASAAWAADDNPFTDVPDTDAADAAFYSEPVEWLWDNSLTTGSPSGSTTFKPLDNVTRGEYATFNFRYDQNVVQPGLTEAKDAADAAQTAADAAQADADAAQAELDGLPVVMWAIVASDGTLGDNSGGGVTSGNIFAGGYEVLFPRDITDCGIVASHGVNDSGAIPGPAFVSVNTRSGKANGAFLATYDATGATANRPFHVVVTCPHDEPEVVVLGAGAGSSEQDNAG